MIFKLTLHHTASKISIKFEKYDHVNCTSNFNRGHADDAIVIRGDNSIRNRITILENVIPNDRKCPFFNSNAILFYNLTILYHL